jgi:DNA-binding transcriptional regulator YiaG
MAIDREAEFNYTDCMPMKGEELRRLRKRMGLTQAQLAVELGSTENTVARWERNEIKVNEQAARLMRTIVPAAPTTKKK